MIGKTLWAEFFNNRDWPLASAVAVILLALGVMTIALRRAPEAREDGTGFHYRHRRRQKGPAPRAAAPPLQHRVQRQKAAP